jgi:hypothetical protein
MRVIYHPDFPRDIKRFEEQYREISEHLGVGFRGKWTKRLSGSKPAQLQQVIFSILDRKS